MACDRKYKGVMAADVRMKDMAAACGQSGRGCQCLSQYVANRLKSLLACEVCNGTQVLAAKHRKTGLRHNVMRF